MKKKNKKTKEKKRYPLQPVTITSPPDQPLGYQKAEGKDQPTRSQPLNFGGIVPDVQEIIPYHLRIEESNPSNSLLITHKPEQNQDLTKQPISHPIREPKPHPITRSNSYLMSLS